jgi:allophanate hydrolase
MNIQLNNLHRQYTQSELLPSECMVQVLTRIDQVDRPEVWIARVPHEEIMARARELDQMFRN